jgi:hypothetical protein
MDRSAPHSAKKADVAKTADPNSQRLLAIGETGSPVSDRVASKAADEPVDEQPAASQPVAEPPASELPIVKQPVVAPQRPPVAELPPHIEPSRKTPELPPVTLPFNAGKTAPAVSRGMLLPSSDDSPAPSYSTPSAPSADKIERWVSDPDSRTASGGTPNLKSAALQGGAAEDHRTLTGHVTSFRKTWRLRYAGIEAEDVFGGSVALNGPGLERLRDGQLVRVQGTIVSASDRGQPAVFEVKSIEVLAPGN